MQSLGDMPGYRVVRSIADGAFAHVSLAEYGDGPSRHRVAIKTMQEDRADDGTATVRFRNEVEVLAQLRHPNTVRLLGMGQLPRPFLMLEFVEGTTLSVRMGEGAWPIDLVARLLRAMGGALAELHAVGYVYRNLSPENVIVPMDWAHFDALKVVDFLLVRRIDRVADTSGGHRASLPTPVHVTRQTEITGVPTYMSPEQFSNRALDARSDVYSLAILAYELLTGELPFQAATQWDWATCHITQPPIPMEQHEAGKALPAHWRAVITAALAKSARDRPSTMTEFLGRLGIQ